MTDPTDAAPTDAAPTDAAPTDAAAADAAPTLAPTLAPTPSETPAPGPDITVRETRVYRGPNFYSYEPAIQMVVDIGRLEQFPTDTLPGFTEALLELLPGLRDHQCSRGRDGGFVERQYTFLLQNQGRNGREGFGNAGDFPRGIGIPRCR